MEKMWLVLSGIIVIVIAIIVIIWLNIQCSGYHCLGVISVQGNPQTTG